MHSTQTRRLIIRSAIRNPALSDDERIADLLKRLTLEEEVELMDGHPMISRLKLVSPDEAEGLHGLALGGPGRWEPRGRRQLPTTIFPQEKGLGGTWDPALIKKIGALEGEEGRNYYQNSNYNFGGIVMRSQCRSESGSALGTCRRVDG